MSNPVLVDTTRGDIVENRHRGTVAVCDPQGRVLHAWGDVDALVYPRSAIKTLQALPLVESGAADHFDVSAAELALACSSHNAEPEHTTAVGAWLKRLDLGQEALECGAHPPLHEQTARALWRKRHEPGKVHNNCSGKHTGMLTTARFFGEQTSGYIEPGHPTQQRWFDTLGEMADLDMRALPLSRDGCGIPVIAMPLKAIATAFARVAAPDDLPAKRADAVDRLGNAIAAHPFMVAGSGRLCTEMMCLTGRRLLVKTGADGVYTAALRDAGIGIAIKIDDGRGEAAEVTLLAVLRYLKALHSDELDALRDRVHMPIVNTRGVTVGQRRPAEIWQTG